MDATQTDRRKQRRKTFPVSHFHKLKSLVLGGQQIFYPIPLKLFGTNSDHRPAKLKISARTANALRNVERNQWLPDYTLNYTGRNYIEILFVANGSSTFYSV